MIPDYVKQMQEIQGQLDSTANVLENDWKDAVKQRFFGDFVTPFDDDVKNFLYGGPNVYGPGLDELLKLMEKQMDAMSKVAGVNVTADVVEVTLGGQRHLHGLDGKIVADAGLHDGPTLDENRDRDYWHRDSPYNHGPKPGEMLPDEMNQLSQEREHSDKTSYDDFRRRMGLKR